MYVQGLPGNNRTEEWNVSLTTFTGASWASGGNVNNTSCNYFIIYFFLILRNVNKERIAIMPVPTIGGIAEIFPDKCNTKLVRNTTLNAIV